MPPDPLPIDALLLNFQTQVNVTFDRVLLDDGAINVANWAVQFAGVTKPVAAASIQGGIVVLAVGPGDPSMDPDGVTFTPPPFDVTTADGGRAPAFANFPLHE